MKYKSFIEEVQCIDCKHYLDASEKGVQCTQGYCHRIFANFVISDIKRKCMFFEYDNNIRKKFHL